MIPDRQLDVRPVHVEEMLHERELLQRNADELRNFYALSGPARKNYTEQMAEAEAKRVRLLRQAQADGLLSMMRAEAEGYRLIGEVLAALPNANQVLEVARLHTVQRVADFLADGKATKVFLPTDLSSVFSLLGVGKDVLDKDQKGEQRISSGAPSTPAT